MGRLVLKRRKLQSLWVGDSQVTVIRIDKNGDVHLAVDAPREVPVDRDELRQRKLAGPKPAQRAA